MSLKVESGYIFVVFYTEVDFRTVHKKITPPFISENREIVGIILHLKTIGVLLRPRQKDDRVNDSSKFTPQRDEKNCNLRSETTSQTFLQGGIHKLSRQKVFKVFFRQIFFFLDAGVDTCKKKGFPIFGPSFTVGLLN